MKLNRAIFLTVAAAIIIGAFAGCSSDDDGGVQIPPPSTGGDLVDAPYEDPEGLTITKRYDGYPEGVYVRSFEMPLSGGQKIVGYYAVLDFVENPDLQFLPRFSAGKKPTKYFSDHLAEGADNPFLAVNGGFFVMTAPPRSYCLLVSDGVVNSRPDPYEWTGPSSSPYQFFPVRGAMGRMADGKFETAWVYCVADDAQRPYAFPSPLDNDERIPSFMPSAPTSKTPGAELWEPQQAIGAGPMLVRDSLNVAEDSYYREVLHYMGQGINGMGRRPRTALGTTRSQRRMVVVVCNGDKVQSSAGITLPELGDLFLRFGCVMAVNLDGGGSSAFVGREGTLLNGLPAERTMPTAVIFAEKK